MNRKTTIIKKQAYRWNGFTVILILTLAVLVTTCSPKPGPGGGGPGPVGAKAFQTQVESHWNGSRITGTVKNLGDEKISFVSVEFDLLDDSRRTLRTVSASNGQGIEPHGDWNFEIEASAVGAVITRLRNTTTR
jgi:hypothetical protein